MAKRAKPEEIIAKLREAEVRLSQGESVAMAAKSIGVTEQTYYRWRKEYGGLQVNQAKRLKDMGVASNSILLTCKRTFSLA